MKSLFIKLSIYITIVLLITTGMEALFVYMDIGPVLGTGQKELLQSLLRYDGIGFSISLILVILVIYYIMLPIKKLDDFLQSIM